MIKLIESG
jgi:hypothetical protein